MKTLARGALAGAAGAGGWALAGPLLERVFVTDYSDVRLAGGLLTRGRLWPVAGLAAHTALGAALGAALTAGGLTSLPRALAGAQAENLLAWPGMAIADRIHPDRRDGTWPPLVTNARVFAQSMAARAIFAAGYSGVLARLPASR